MNRRRLPFALIAVLLLAAVAAGALLLSRPAPPPAGPLTGAAIGGPFALTDQNGRTVTAASLKGRYPLYYFGYTFCPDVCPLDAANIGKGLRMFETAAPDRTARVVPVFVTVDPVRDTPAVLKVWLAAFHPRFVGLTGTVAQIDAVRAEFRVFAQKSGTGPDYLVDHSAAIYLFGPDGLPISFVERGATPAAIAAELDRYVR